MEYVVYGYSLFGSVVKLKAFKSLTFAKKYAERVSDELDEPVFLREREPFDHDEDFHPYRFGVSK